MQYTNKVKIYAKVLITIKQNSAFYQQIHHNCYLQKIIHTNIDKKKTTVGRCTSL